MRYKCISPFYLEKCDGDGFWIGEYMEVESGEIYETGDRDIIGGEIHLNGVNVNRWIEISKETLDEYFEEVEV